MRRSRSTAMKSLPSTAFAWPSTRWRHRVSTERSSNTIPKLTVTCAAEQITPGPNPIDITVIAPSTIGTLHATTNTQSLGSLDLNPANDNASADVVVYDPAVCRALTPLPLGPPDESAQPAIVPLSWSAVEGAQSYTVYTDVEGALASPRIVTDRREAALVGEPGRSEWWVEATFSNCPPIDSERRHFVVSSTVPHNVVVYAGNPNVAATQDGPRATATFRKPYGLALSAQHELY